MRSVFRGRALAALLAAVLVAVLVGVTLAESKAASDGRPDLHSEIGVGGLIFSGNLNLTIDQQDVTIAADAVQVNYSIRNADDSDQTITIAFPFADVDGTMPPDVQTGIAVSNPSNFMDIVIDVDGRRPTFAVEQRATAVGLDVTKAIIDAQLPLFPLAADLSQRLADLDPAVRNDLVERGVLKVDDDVVSPAWTLKTTAYWRQVFPAGQTLALSLTYKPITGRNAFSSGALQPLKKGVCVDAGAEQLIVRLASQGTPLTMVAVGYVAHPGAEALGPVGRFRLTVDQSVAKSIVATCRQGLRKTGPTTSDWVATNYAMDEEFRVLFVR